MNESEMFKKIEGIKDRLSEYVKYSFLLNKILLGVGGGFSAGKSCFINSIIGIKSLPVDIDPTTAVPTYIVGGKNDKYFLLNNYESMVEINYEDFQALTHNRLFRNVGVKENISLINIIESIVCFFEKFEFKNLVIIDTPGYTKSDISLRKNYTDENIARSQLEKVNYLIWVVDIDNGTIKKDDIDFIKKLKVNGFIYFVLNKADKKPKNEIEIILDNVYKLLENEKIIFKGISAYSSKEKIEYCYKKSSLMDFINFVNNRKSVDKLSIIEKELIEIFSCYEKHLIEKIDELSRYIKEITKASLFYSNLETLNNEFVKNRKYYENLKYDLLAVKEKVLSQFVKLEMSIKNHTIQ